LIPHAATDTAFQGDPVGFETALYVAADEGNLDIIKFLLEHGAATNIPGQNVLGSNEVSLTPQSKEAMMVLHCTQRRIVDIWT
jgi:hypothetical protein